MDRLPTISFQGQAVSFREFSSIKMGLNSSRSWFQDMFLFSSIAGEMIQFDKYSVNIFQLPQGMLKTHHSHVSFPYFKGFARGSGVQE